MSYVNFFDHPLWNSNFLQGTPYRIANFLGPPICRISLTFFVDFLLQKVEKDHPPTELQTFPDYPPTELERFSDHPHMEFLMV